MDADDCCRCDGPLPGAGHYVELEWPGDDGLGKIAGSLCDDCADEIASHFPPSARQRMEVA